MPVIALRSPGLLTQAGLFVVFAISIASAEPYVPQDDHMVLASVPVDAALVRLRAGQRRVDDGATDPSAAIALAHEWLELGRRRADPRFDGYAEAALAAWREAPNPPLELGLVRARLFERRHDFNSARAELDRLIERRPGFGPALLARAALWRIRGDAPVALGDCRAAANDVGLYLATACVAETMGLGAAAERARLMFERLVDQEQVVAATQAHAVRLAAAELAIRNGELNLAQRHLDAARRIEPVDPYRAALQADVWIAAGQHAKVLEAVSADAPLVLALRRAISVKAMGGNELELNRRLRGWFESEQARGEPIHSAERALWRLDVEPDAARALAAARLNWSEQKRPHDLWLLARAALAAGDADAVQAVREWISDTGLIDVRIAALLAKAP